MKKTSIILFLLLFSSYSILLFSGACFLIGTDPDLKPPTKITFNPQIYRDLLTQLKANNYTILRAKDFYEFNYINGCKIAVIVHDVDGQVPISGSRILSSIEEEYGVRSSFYIRVDSDYFEQSISFFQNLEQKGHEIALHYSCLTRTGGNYTLASQLLEAQVTYLRAFFNVTTVRYHGDSYDYSIWNRWLFEEHPEVYAKISVSEASGLPGTYIRDSEAKLVIPPVEEWETIILVNFHADHWG